MRGEAALREGIEVACSPSAYAEVAGAWRAVWDANPFLSLEWHDAWWRTLGEGTPEIVVVRDGDGVVGVGPFVRRDDGRLVFSGDDLTDELDVLARNEDVLARLARHVAATAAWVELRYIPEGSPSLAAIPRALAAAGHAVRVEPLVVSPRIALAPSFEAYLATLTTKDRHELRRKLRRLERAGAPSFAWAAEASEALERFVAWHRRAPGEKGGFLTPERERFFRELVRAGQAAGWLRLGELRLDARPIATLVALEWNGTLAAYNSAVDPDAAALSPGILLHAYALRDAIARGLRTYDLLRGAEPYKYDLGARDRVLMRISARTAG